jgi:hypothetical protein
MPRRAATPCQESLKLPAKDRIVKRTFTYVLVPWRCCCFGGADTYLDPWVRAYTFFLKVLSNVLLFWFVCCFSATSTDQGHPLWMLQSGALVPLSAAFSIATKCMVTPMRVLNTQAESDWIARMLA